MSPDGTTVVTGCSDGSVRRWDAANGKLIGKSVAHDGHFSALRFSPDGKTLVTVGSPRVGPGPVRLWNAASGAAIGAELRTQGFTSAVAFSRDGKTVITASYLGVAVWDASSGRLIGPAVKDAKTIIAAAFSPDGQKVLICSDETSARLWDVTTGRHSAHNCRIKVDSPGWQ